MKTTALVILLIIGCVWTLFTLWMLLTIAGVAGPIVSPWAATLYWSRWFIGPMMLTAGASLLLWRSATKISVGLIAAACVVLSAITIFTVVEEFHRKPLQAPPPYEFLAAMVAICVVADSAGYIVLRGTRKQLIT